MRLYLSAGIFLLTACTPPNATGPTEKRAAALTLETNQQAETSPPTIDRSKCGLPPEIREADWPRRLHPTVRRPPAPVASGSVSLAVLPDTQYYASCREDHLSAQAQWVAREFKQRKMLATLQLGDLTEHNTPDEWKFVQEKLAPLSEAGPLLVASGNHDYGNHGSADERHTLFDEYFSKPAKKTKAVVAETMTKDSLENAYYRIEAPGFTLGVLILEWSPRQSSVAWAKEALKAYPNDKKIFITHAYLYYDGTRYDWAKYQDQQKWSPFVYGTALRDTEAKSEPNNWIPEGVYDGERLWKELLFSTPGLFLTLNGHVLGDGSGVLTSQGEAGNQVHQVLTNFQMLDEGGLGYLRLIEIDAQGESMKMSTFSPSLGLSAIGSEQEFELPLQPPLFD